MKARIMCTSFLKAHLNFINDCHIHSLLQVGHLDGAGCVLCKRQFLALLTCASKREAAGFIVQASQPKAFLCSTKTLVAWDIKCMQ